MHEGGRKMWPGNPWMWEVKSGIREKEIINEEWEIGRASCRERV